MGSQTVVRAGAPPAVAVLVAALWAVAVGSVVLGLALLAAPDGPVAPHGFGSATGDAIVALAYAGGASVGALIAVRRPELPLGWLMLAAGLLTATASAASEYYTVALAYGFPGPQLAAWYGAWAWKLGAGLAVSFALLLFPTGRLPSRRWRVVAAASGVAVGVTVLAQMFAPGPLTGEFRLAANPLGLTGVQWLRDVVSRAWVVLLGLTALSALSLVARSRRARPVERAQLKWFTYAAVLTVAALALRGPATFIHGGPLWTQALLVFAVLSFPVAFGVAVLRYRLFDIQRVVSRTLSYGLLTALLAGIYYAAALVAGRLLARFELGGDLAVAAATLVAAALFRPARVRIQDAVDRRFNRSRFDGARTLDAFVGDLRDETELEGVVDRLLESVGGTMQPAAVSVWLPAPRVRETARERREAGGAHHVDAGVRVDA